MKNKIKLFIVTLFWKQNKWHRHSVLVHTLKVIYHTTRHKEWKMIPAAILHDIGKPIVAYQDDEDKITGDYSFTDHEERSYQIIKKWPISSYTKDLVRHHYLIRDMSNSKKKGNIIRHEIKKKAWDSLDKKMQGDLKRFLKYDDLGK